MLIRVIYQDDTYDMVKPLLLDMLISENKIKKFRRSEGWAAVGIDRMRGIGGYHDGYEKRKNIMYGEKAQYSLGYFIE
jgi:hypothetical protein